MLETTREIAKEESSSTQTRERIDELIRLALPKGGAENQEERQAAYEELVRLIAASHDILFSNEESEQEVIEIMSSPRAKETLWQALQKDADLEKPEPEIESRGKLTAKDIFRKILDIFKGKLKF